MFKSVLYCFDRSCFLSSSSPAGPENLTSSESPEAPVNCPGPVLPVKLAAPAFAYQHLRAGTADNVGQFNYWCLLYAVRMEKSSASQ
ncbi:hypothetical protein Y1Q_0010232 [Alligator mississippiensis]|uniref:Uncharacterized protein n=1 Tax=Alligator mississippiensis TaxID=8496 RepID=A0A151NGC9_ALLMI|nr:hypothetical protein Y1Q_0010232 [Alligator mississippiensis]